jgi:hypothetical protein
VAHAAFVKVTSGQVSGAWAEGAVMDEWKLCGTVYRGLGGQGYSSSHPYALSDSGSMLVALPATVLGHVDLSEPLNWWLFPELNDGVDGSCTSFRC